MRKCFRCYGYSLSDSAPNYFCEKHWFEWCYGVSSDEQRPQNPIWRFHALSEQPVG